MVEGRFCPYRLFFVPSSKACNRCVASTRRRSGLVTPRGTAVRSDRPWSTTVSGSKPPNDRPPSRPSRSHRPGTRSRSPRPGCPPVTAAARRPGAPWACRRVAGARRGTRVAHQSGGTAAGLPPPSRRPPAQIRTAPRPIPKRPGLPGTGFWPASHVRWSDAARAGPGRPGSNRSTVRAVCRGRARPVARAPRSRRTRIATM